MEKRPREIPYSSQLEDTKPHNPVGHHETIQWLKESRTAPPLAAELVESSFIVLLCRSLDSDGIAAITAESSNDSKNGPWHEVLTYPRKKDKQSIVYCELRNKA